MPTMTANSMHLDMEIVSTSPLTPTVRELVLRRVDGKPYPFISGQHLIVYYGNKYREFSIASSARIPETVRLAVRDVGVVSHWLHERAVGDVIQATEANGQEFHPKYLAGRDLWLIAGGIGLTGLVSTICELEHQFQRDPSAFAQGRFGHRLFYGLSNRNELLWPEELERWRKVLTIDITGDGRHLIGDLLPASAEASAGKLGPIDTVTALVCGSQEFYDVAFQVLQRIGIQRTRILTNIWE